MHVDPCRVTESVLYFIFSTSFCRLRASAIGAGVVLCSSLTALLLTHSSGHTASAVPGAPSPPPIGAGHIGMALKWALMLTSLGNWAIRALASLEQALVSVHRMDQYTRGAPAEEGWGAARVLEADHPQWAKGDVDVQGATAWYQHARPPTPESARKGQLGRCHHTAQGKCEETGLPVLRELTLFVPSGQHVGICGRTGGGKSSFLLAILRQLEFGSQGSIRIGDLDVKRASPRSVRKCVTYLPQHPVLFDDTVRVNLDPRGVHRDGELWDALQV